MTPVCSPLEYIRDVCAPYAALLLATAWIGVGISYSQLYLFHIVLALYVWRLTSIVLALRVIETPVMRQMILPLAYLLWMLVAVIWSVDREAALRHVVYHGLGTVLMFIVVLQYGHREGIAQVLKPVGLVLLIELVMCVMEFATPFRYPISPYSTLASIFGHSAYLNASWTDAMIQIALSSPTGFHWNPNSLAAALIIALPFFLFAPQRRMRFFGSALIVVILFFTGSRASYVACLVALAFWAFAFSARRALCAFSAAIGLFFVLAAALSSAVSYEDNQRLQAALELVDIADRVGSADLYSDESSISTRMRLISTGIDKIVESRGLGVGGGNSQVMLQDPLSKEWRLMPLHNFWLEIVVEAGVLMGLLVIGWYSSLIWRVYTVARCTDDSMTRYVASSCATALVAFVPAAVSASSVIYFLPMWLLLGVAVAVVVASGSEKQRTLVSHPVRRQRQRIFGRVGTYRER